MWNAQDQGKLMIWHYAVWKSRIPYMWPACRSTSMMGMMPDPPITHGLTINRGDVTCKECLEMMGGSA